uniref:Tyrosine specific protein phosphatases domain-containing protein n=1 Tax=Sinocyclocheilus rhinocerous TaxID=307959 RepID=A0A673H3L8_9TELE
MARKYSSKEYLSVKDLEKVLDSCKLNLHQIDEVWPNLYIGNVSVANDGFSVWKLGITRVLNAAHGKMHCHEFYGSTFFTPALIISEVLRSPGERVLVQCAAGVSRSASLVLAHLMIHQHLSLLEAIKALRALHVTPHRTERNILYINTNNIPASPACVRPSLIKGFCSTARRTFSVNSS